MPRPTRSSAARAPLSPSFFDDNDCLDDDDYDPMQGSGPDLSAVKRAELASKDEVRLLLQRIKLILLKIEVMVDEMEIPDNAKCPVCKVSMPTILSR